MKRNGTRLLAVLLVLCMAVAMLPVSALAADTLAVITTADGSVSYTTAKEFETAFEAISGEATVTLENDVNVGNTLTVPKAANITLDLKGHVLTPGDRWVSLDGALTLRDSVGGGKVASSASSLYTYAGSTLVLDGATIESDWNAIYAYGGTIHIKKGTVRSTYPSLTTTRAALKGDKADVTIGEIGGDDSAILIDGGGTYGLLFGENIKAYSGTVSSVYGTFGENTVLSCRLRQSADEVLPAGKVSKPFEDGGETFYRVEDLTDPADVAATVGDRKYASIPGALGSLQQGETVVLEKDYVGTRMLKVEVFGVTIDLNGHSVTNTRDGYDAYGIQIRPTASKVPENALVTVRNSGDKQSVITGVSGIYATTPASNRQFPLALEGDIALRSTAEVEQPLKLGYAYVVYTPEAAAIVKNGGFLAENDTGAYIYGSFGAAVKADTDKTVTLVNDFTGSDMLGLSSGTATLDLGGHTYTTKGTGVKPTSDGVSITVKNGTIVSTGQAGVGAELLNNNTSLTLEKVHMSGEGDFGIVTHGTVTGVKVNLVDSSVTAANGFGIYFPSENSTLTVQNSNVTGGTALGVKGGTVTVSGDSVIHGTGAKQEPSEPSTSGIMETGSAVYLEGNYDRDVAVNLEGGRFVSDNADALKSLFLTGNGTKKMVVSGGTYSSNPTEFLAAGKAVQLVDGLYEVVDLPPVEGADVAVAEKEPEITSDVQLPADFPAETLEKTELPELPTLAADAAGEVDAADVAAAKEKLANAGLPTDDVTLVVEAYLSIAVSGYDDASGELTIDIEPRYDVKATTDRDAMNDTNTVLVTEKNTLTVTEPVTLTVPVPEKLATTDAPIYVRHEKSETESYLYTTTKGDGTVTFVNPNGFSKFVLFADARTGTIRFLDEKGELFEERSYTLLEIGTDLPEYTLEGYRFDGWQIGESVYTELTEELLNALSGQQGAVTATPVLVSEKPQEPDNPSNPGGPSEPGSGYTVLIAETPNGTVSASPRTAKRGDTVTVLVQPDEGYVLGSLEVIDNTGNKMELTRKSATKYTFVMDASKVRVTATFVPGTDGLPFTDVNDTQWFYDAVRYVYQNGLMDGTSETEFMPDLQLSRAMIAQVLYNMEGLPEVEWSGAFEDVTEGQWFAEAVNWAASAQIVDGVGDGMFAPDEPLTREQLAAILFRYASYKGYGTGLRGDLAVFTDGAETSDWALHAVQWAVGSGLLSGNGDGTLAPKGTATRAQVAKILMVFCESVAK